MPGTQMDAKWLLNWWNLIFVVPFGLALLYLGLYVISGVSFGEADADADADVDADVDADLDADADVADADGDHEAGSGGGHGAFMATMGWLGAGRVPLSLLMMVLMMAWGFIGFSSNLVLRPRLGESAMLPLISMALAGFLGALVTRGTTRFIGRVLPMSETSARRRHDLLGLTGEAIYDIDGRSGTVCVRDGSGELFQVGARAGREQPAIAKGSKVILTAFNAKANVFVVVPQNQSESGAATIAGRGA